MTETRVRRLRVVAGALVVAVALAGCSPFEMDPGVMRELDEEVASWDLTSAGEVIAECSDSAALGAQYHYTLVLRGEEAWRGVQQQLADAGFEPRLAEYNDDERASFELTDSAGTWWSAGMNLTQGDATTSSYCGHTDAEVGDTSVGLIAVPGEESR
ncbi:MAG: hypothetical protein QM675_07400 [Protaetiibacter sp.]